MLRKNDILVRADHEAVRNQVGYYDFTHKLLEVVGKDAGTFLDRMFVGKIGKAKVGTAKYTTMLNEKGVIIDDVIVFHIEENTFWVSTLYIDELIAWFNDHKAGETVSYREITGITTMYAVQGPNSPDVLNAMMDQPVDELKHFHIADNSFNGISVKVANSGYTGEKGYEIYCHPSAASSVESKLEDCGKKYGIRKITTDTIVTSLPREKGYVLMSDLAGTNPYEVGFDWSVDWSKYFIGKEALTKVRDMGAARALLGFAVEDPAVEVQAGAEVRYGSELVGKVTTYTYGYTVEKNIGFALVDTSKVNVGDQVRIGGLVDTVLTERVFYDPKNLRTKGKNVMSSNDALKQAEHDAVRRAVGYYDFTHKLLEVVGEDAAMFLDRIFVGKIAKAKVGQAKYTTMLNEKGEIIDDIIVFRMADDAYWVSTLYIDELIAWFNAHIAGENVRYREITNSTTMYAVQGPKSRDVLNVILAKKVDELKHFHITDNTIDGAAVKIARSGYTGELGYEIYCDPSLAGMIERKLERAGKAYGIKKITTDVIVTSLPREKGYVLMSDLVGTNPLEVGFDWTIDWGKYFVGREALAKVRNSGAKRALLGFTVSDAKTKVDVGAQVMLNGEIVGKVTMYTYGYSVEKNIGFVLVDLDKADIGDMVTVGDNRVRTVLTERMFYVSAN